MKRQGISKAKLAALMQTSRAGGSHPEGGEQRDGGDALQRAAALVGRELRVELG